MSGVGDAARARALSALNVNAPLTIIAPTSKATGSTSGFGARSFGVFPRAASVAVPALDPVSVRLDIEDGGEFEGLGIFVLLY